jgi:carbamate kinase
VACDTPPVPGARGASLPPSDATDEEAGPISTSAPPRAETDRLAVVAVGGNALAGGQEGLDRALATVATEVGAIAADGWRLVVVHGSGPQVGLSLRRSELSSHEVPPLPMDLATAETQGSLGVLLQRAIADRLSGGQRGRCVSLVTQALVAADDAAMSRPTKPIGPTMEEARARTLAARHGWEIVRTDRGWRRVVPSPQPRAVIEIDAIRALVGAGQVVIAGGGGGVPVLRSPSGSLRGVEAVIDKDLTAGLLARELEADALVIGTTVARIALDLDTPAQRWLDRVGAAELRDHHAAGQFPPGSMGPKVEALLAYVEAGGGHAAIGDLEHLRSALAGTHGTLVTSP